MKDWFTPIVDRDKLHPKFKNLIDPVYHNEKELLKKWIKKFIVKDGDKKTIKEFQTTFNSTIWEVYLNKVILSSGSKINEQIKSPDFFIEKGDKKASIEAVVSNIAMTGIPESERTIEDVYGENDHYEVINESIIRLASAISYKSEKYHKKYIENNDVRNNPYVIAISDHAQIRSGQTSYFSLLAVLYGAYYDPNDKTDFKILGNDNIDREYKYIDKIKNKNDSNIMLELFASDKYRHISAVIYSCTMTLGKLSSLSNDHIFPKFIIIEREEFKKIRYSGTSTDEYLLDGLFVFHNPYADKKFSEEFIQGNGVTHISFDEDDYDEQIKINTQGRYSSLVRRFVGMRGDEQYLIDDIDNFQFFPSSNIDLFKI